MKMVTQVRKGVVQRFVWKDGKWVRLSFAPLARHCFRSVDSFLSDLHQLEEQSRQKFFENSMPGLVNASQENKEEKA